MPGPFPLAFGPQSNPGRDGQAGTGRLINAYAEFAGDEGKSAYPIYAIEGLTSLAFEATAGGNRGMLELNGSAYSVAGQQILKVDPDGTDTFLGGMPGTGPVFMDRNLASPSQIVFVSDGNVRVVTSDAVTVFDDPDLPPPNSVTHIGGFFVFSIADGRFFVTGANNITVDALDFATAEANPDGLVRAFAFNDILVLFGNKSTEFWANVGAADFPFIRMSNGVISRGCMSAASVAQIAESVLWIDHDGVVLRAAGTQPQIVSTHAVERSIAAEPSKSSISAMVYTIRGHQFYVLSGTTFTWVLDLRTGFWHERKSYGLARWRGEGYAKLGNTHVCGDYSSGRFYTIDDNAHTENGEHIVWEVISPAVHAGQQPVGHARVDLDMIRGVGLNSANTNAASPVVELRYSDNGGKSWSTWRSRGLGEIGEYEKPIRFRKLGQAGAQGRTYHIRSTSPVIRGLIDAHLWTA